VDSTAGAEIISFHLQARDNIDNRWIDLHGYDSYESLATLHQLTVVKGTYYELRFRVKNQVGWSDYSPVSYFTAADSPSEPNAPVLISFSSTEIALEFDPSTIDDGGLPLESYMLEITDDVTNGFTTVASYLGESSYTLDAVTDSLAEGTIYTIRWYATNEKGDGIRSDEI
jgi:hypothetical protein